MRRGNWWVALAAGAMMTVGCGMQSGNAVSKGAKGGIAVIDLDVVAKAIGRTQDMSNAIATKRSAYDQTLQRAEADFKRQIVEKKTEFGEAPTDEQSKLLQRMEQTAGTQLVNGARKAQSELSQYQTQLIAEFRAEIRPVAQQVAAEKGLGVVIPKNEGFLLAIDPGVDITADVIKALQAKPLAPAAAKAPQAAPQAPTRPQAAAPQTAAQPMETEQN